MLGAWNMREHEPGIHVFTGGEVMPIGSLATAERPAAWVSAVLRWTRKKSILVAVLFGVAGAWFFRLTLVGIGVGHFSQELVFDSDARVERVRYCTCHIDEGIRKRAEETADPRLFEWDDAEPLDANRFRLSIKFTSQAGLSWGDSIYHQPQLIVYAEFADSKTICRVLDLPPGKGVPEVVINFRWFVVTDPMRSSLVVGR
jgi:hypothetical protein